MLERVNEMEYVVDYGKKCTDMGFFHVTTINTSLDKTYKTVYKKIESILSNEHGRKHVRILQHNRGWWREWGRCVFDGDAKAKTKVILSFFLNLYI